MNVFDLVVLVILIFLAMRGYMKGMVSQIVSVGSWIVCWIVASRFAFVIAPSIPAQEPWNQVGAIIVLFVIAMIAVRFAHSIIEKWMKRLYLKGFDRVLGGVLGGLKGVLICMVLTFFGVMLSEMTRTIVFQSKSGNTFANLIEKTEAFIPEDSCELLRKQLQKFDAKVKGTPLEGGGDTSLELDGLQKDIQLIGDKIKSSKEAISLLDGISKWWNGESDKTSNEKDGTSRSPVSDILQKAEQTLLGERKENELQDKSKAPTLTDFVHKAEQAIAAGLKGNEKEAVPVANSSNAQSSAPQSPPSLGNILRQAEQKVVDVVRTEWDQAAKSASNETVTPARPGQAAVSQEQVPGNSSFRTAMASGAEATTSRAPSIPRIPTIPTATADLSHTEIPQSQGQPPLPVVPDAVHAMAIPQSAMNSLVPPTDSDHPVRSPQNLIEAATSDMKTERAALIFEPRKRRNEKTSPWDPKTWAGALNK